MRLVFVIVLTFLFTSCSDEEKLRTVISKIAYEREGDPNGSSMQVFTYDNLGRVTKSENHHSISTSVNTFEYEGKHLAKEYISLKEDGIETLYLIKTYAYDSEGRLAQITQVDQEVFSVSISKFFWTDNHIDKMERYVHDELLNSQQYLYDSRGNIIQIKTFDEMGSLETIWDFEYDNTLNSLSRLYPSNYAVGHVLYTSPNNMIASEFRNVFDLDIVATEEVSFTFYKSGLTKERMNSLVSFQGEHINSKHTIFYKEI